MDYDLINDKKSHREKKAENAKNKWVVHKTLWVPRSDISKNLYFSLHKKKKPKIKK